VRGSLIKTNTGSLTISNATIIDFTGATTITGGSQLSVQWNGLGTGSAGNSLSHLSHHQPPS